MLSRASCVCMAFCARSPTPATALMWGTLFGLFFYIGFYWYRHGFQIQPPVFAPLRVSLVAPPFAGIMMSSAVSLVVKPRNLKGFKSQGMVVCAVGALGDGKVRSVVVGNSPAAPLVPANHGVAALLLYVAVYVWVFCFMMAWSNIENQALAAHHMFHVGACDVDPIEIKVRKSFDIVTTVLLR